MLPKSCIFIIEQVISDICHSNTTMLTKQVTSEIQIVLAGRPKTKNQLTLYDLDQRSRLGQDSTKPTMFPPGDLLSTSAQLSHTIQTRPGHKTD